MGSPRYLLLLLLLLIQSLYHQRLLEAIRHSLKPVWKCPYIRVKCAYPENRDCLKHKDCMYPEKCCPFSCGRKCINPREDPCEDNTNFVPCPETLYRWFYNVTENECYPFEYSPCSKMKNSFQSREVCKKTCLAFGHGVPLKLFELNGESFTIRA